MLSDVFGCFQMFSRWGRALENLMVMVKHLREDSVLKRAIIPRRRSGHVDQTLKRHFASTAPGPIWAYDFPRPSTATAAYSKRITRKDLDDQHDVLVGRNGQTDLDERDTVVGVGVGVIWWEKKKY